MFFKKFKLYLVYIKKVIIIKLGIFLNFFYKV